TARLINTILPAIILLSYAQLALLLGQFKVIVPAEPVDTTVGSSIVLPCRLSPEMSAAAMEVRWFKENFDNLVFLYKEGKETEGSDYRSRVRLFRQEMERGNVSLLLQNVRISDQGLYKCHVSSVDWYEEPQLQLRVTREYKRSLVVFCRYVIYTDGKKETQQLLLHTLAPPSVWNRLKSDPSVKRT
uniref:Ig-like domain-containing protein n=1 Tax=Lepisosteus oculatus TaxID=7918 RepID=W5M2S2_LEPOC